MIYQTNRWWVFDFHDDFREKWEKEHGQNPESKEWIIRKNFYSQGTSKYGDKEVPCTYVREPTDFEAEELKKIAQEQKEYRLQKDRYIAQRVFDEIGYDEFLIEAERSGHKEWIYEHTFAPCLSADAQCCIDCPIWSYCHEH